MIPTLARTNCVCCGGKNLECVFELPHLPLTGMYVSQDTPMNTTLAADTSFLYCYDCGQGQLSNIVDPALQYDDKYWFRTSTSPIATSGIQFFQSFFEKVVKDRKFDCLLELGCNDLHLLRRIQTCAKQSIGIDPIWENREFSEGNISVRGSLDSATHPDLIVSEHTFEHLSQPAEMLERLVTMAKDGALFFIEIPSLECLVQTHRFDQVFHQHLNYFGLHSLQKFIARVGCSYLTHAYNPGYWGSLIVVFEKTSGDGTTTIPLQYEDIQQRYDHFKHRMEAVRHELNQQQGPVYGYGAAQIAPMLGYYLNTDFHELTAFLDEDERKWGKKYANLYPEIKNATSVALTGQTILLTALDYAQVLIPKLQAQPLRHLIIPRVD